MGLMAIDELDWQERSVAETVIVPRGRWALPRLGELAGSMGLLKFLVRRDIKVRYSQTLFGVSWAVIHPLATMLIFWAVFGGLLGVRPATTSYPLFALAGITIWNLFSQGMVNATASLVSRQEQITKIYYPRLLIPLTAIAVALVDFSIGLAMVMVVALATGGANLGPDLLLAPVFVVMAVVVATGVGAALGALNVLYRDVRYLVGFLAQLWLFATPVAYPASLVPEHLRWLAGLNPMSGIVEGFRWSLLGTPAPEPMLLIVSAATAALSLIGGLLLFGALEDRFADLI
jgi:lipopolysaccharide transport system permease protein